MAIQTQDIVASLQYLELNDERDEVVHHAQSILPSLVHAICRRLQSLIVLGLHRLQLARVSVSDESSAFES